MLETFAVEGGAASGCAHEEAAAAGIAEGPDGIADALEPEHRVIRVEGNHRHAVCRVRLAGGRETAHGAGFGDALFQDLAVLGFLVVEELIGIDGFVQLAVRGVDRNLAEEAFHAEGAGFVRDDRHDQLAQFLVLQQCSQDADEGHSRRYGASA